MHQLILLTIQTQQVTPL